MKQKKILLAIQSRQLEEMIEIGLKGEYKFVGIASYREALEDKVKETNPDIILIREALPGNKTIIATIKEVRLAFPHIRVIFMTGRRQAGDRILTELVTYGVYDLLMGDKVTRTDILELIRNPKTLSDVGHLMPQNELDESNTDPAFNVVEVPVVKYVERPAPSPPPIPVVSPEPVVVSPPEPPSQQEEPVPPIVVSVEPEPIKEVPEPSKHKVMPLPNQRVKPDAGVVSQPAPAFDPPAESEADVPDGTTEPEISLDFDPTAIGRSHAPEPRPESMVVPDPTPGPRKMMGLPKKKKAKKPEVDFNPMMMSLPAPSNMQMTQAKQIITFVGAAHGIGNTQIAFNTAIKLAQGGYKVLFMETNPIFSTIDFAYQLGEYSMGIDKALEEIGLGNTKNIKKSIISMKTKKERAKGQPALSKMYKRIPDSLDLLFYSQDFQTMLEKPNINKEYLKDLCMYLLLQEGYDYVVVDSEPLGTPGHGLEDVLSISSKIYLTVTQDAAQAGHATRHLKDIEKRINLQEKLYIVINKYQRVEPDEKLIAGWLEFPIAVIFPEIAKDFISANYLGIPFVIHSKSKETQQVFEILKNKIME